MLEAGEVTKWRLSRPPICQIWRVFFFFRIFLSSGALNLVGPIFVACAFVHLPIPPSSPGGTKRATQEKAAAEEKKWLHHEKARKHEAC